MKRNMYVIPCFPFGERTKDSKPYHVIIDSGMTWVICTCRFFRNQGIKLNEPCKHIQIVVASIKIFPDLLLTYEVHVPIMYVNEEIRQ